MEKDIAALEALLQQTIEADEGLDHRFKLITSIKGMGLIAAATLLAHMPELGILAATKIAALAGLAPITQQSGKWFGAYTRRQG